MTYLLARNDSGALTFAQSLARRQYACDLINSGDRHDSKAAACKTGKLCKGRCIPKNHKCHEGASLSSSQSGKNSHYDHPANITAAYNSLGGDEYAQELTQLNPKMNTKTAKSYIREASRSLLMSHDDYEMGDRELKRVNKKYESFFNDYK